MNAMAPTRPTRPAAPAAPARAAGTTKPNAVVPTASATPVKPAGPAKASATPIRRTGPAQPAVRPERRTRRAWLTTEPAASGEARGQVREAIWSWKVPVDTDAAELLTSELVTNAIRHELGNAVMLAISCSDDHLRVDVYDTSDSLPTLVDAQTGAEFAETAETGRGLRLVEALSDNWGFYSTPAGKAVYFTLTFGPDRTPAVGERGPQGVTRGDGESRPLPRFAVPAQPVRPRQEPVRPRQAR